MHLFSKPIHLTIIIEESLTFVCLTHEITGGGPVGKGRLSNVIVKHLPFFLRHSVTMLEDWLCLTHIQCDVLIKCAQVGTSFTHVVV